MTLRDQCVEAAARGICLSPELDETPDFVQKLHRLRGERAFDAILETLEANAAEWEGVAVAEFGSEAYLHVAQDLRPFIAALRNPNVEEETR